jgi:hypothetical protein
MDRNSFHGRRSGYAGIIVEINGKKKRPPSLMPFVYYGAPPRFLCPIS